MTPEQLAAALHTLLTQAVADGDLTLEVPALEAVRVERPRSREHGDWATNIALQLAKQSGMPPRQLAELVAARLGRVEGVAAVDVAGPGFLNITLDAASAGELARTIVEAGESFGRGEAFAGERDALVLGAGGAGAALTWCLAERDDRPRRIVVTDPSPARREHLAAVHERRGTPVELLQLEEATDERVAALVAELPAGSLVVNASGLGKDRPGSPLPSDLHFPENAFVWEFNYRGTLEFLQQAREQQEARGLTVVDGWRYFIHGWTQVIGEVFDIAMTPELVDRLAAQAEAP